MYVQHTNYIYAAKTFYTSCRKCPDRISASLQIILTKIPLDAKNTVWKQDTTSSFRVLICSQFMVIFPLSSFVLLWHLHVLLWRRLVMAFSVATQTRIISQREIMAYFKMDKLSQQWPEFPCAKQKCYKLSDEEKQLLENGENCYTLRTSANLFNWKPIPYRPIHTHTHQNSLIKI